MSFVLANVPTQNDYSDQATLRCPGAVRVRVTVSNEAVLWQFGRGVPNPVWEEEMHDVPLIGTFERRCDAVRFKSAAAGQPARVSVEARTEAEIGV